MADAAAQLRQELRPHGTVSPRCTDCIFFKVCGGHQSSRPLLTCFDQCRCNRECCDEVCPRRPDFISRLIEVGGLRFDNLAPLGQNCAQLPLYVPHVHHGSSRSFVLTCPVVAVETYRLFQIAGGQYRTFVDDPASLRRLFRLRSDTRVVLRGTASDKPLETYWSYRRRDRAAEQLARLGVDSVIAPNFSHFLDVPRTDNLYNRKRQLVCIEEMQAAGLNVVPHLSAVTLHDWLFWGDYLRANPTVVQIAVEFQTGNKERAEGMKVLDRIHELQQFLGRRLHSILIGASQFVEAAAARFGSFTLTDSEPFMKAAHRKLFVPKGRQRRWVSQWTLPGMGIDQLLGQNVTAYARWIASRCRAVSAFGKEYDKQAI